MKLLELHSRQGVGIIVVPSIYSLPAVFFSPLGNFVSNRLPNMFAFALLILTVLTVYSTVRAVMLLGIGCAKGKQLIKASDTAPLLPSLHMAFVSLALKSSGRSEWACRCFVII